MTKKTNKAFEITDTEPLSYKAHTLTTYEVIKDTKEFLNYHFKGAYADRVTALTHKKVDFSPDGFSYILKLIFKSVFGRSLITVSDILSPKTLEFIIEFKTEFLSPEDVIRIEETANKSNIQIEFSSEALTLKLPISKEIAPHFAAISIRKVYNSLSNIFFGA